MRRSLVIVFCATLALGLVLGTSIAAVFASNQQQQVPQWEYQVIICFNGVWAGTANGDGVVMSYTAGSSGEEIGAGKGPGSCTVVMDELGAQGFELVTVVGSSDFYFKRPITK